MSIIKFLRKIIYYKTTETPSELFKREQKVLQEILGISTPPYEQLLTKKCLKCHGPKILPLPTGEYICLNCESTFVDEETQRRIKDILDKSHLDEESQHRIKDTLDETTAVMVEGYHAKEKPSN